MTLRLPGGRFDDLVAGTAVQFPPPERVVTAAVATEVLPALRELQAATSAGAWAYGFLAYEAAAGLDPSLPVGEPDPNGPPLLWFGVGGPPQDVLPLRAGSARAASRWVPDWSDAEHAGAVERVRRHIAAGDTYQVNLTDRLRANPLRGDPVELYADLALAQRGAFNAYLDTGAHVVVSASPELFLEWSGERLRTRPMKGTAARGPTTAADRERAAALLADPKERAENLMIVDLLRNDLSRVAVTGSVQVPELFAVERYPTVWQLTSEITARTRPGVELVEVLTALFPCGSITGAPKGAAMRVIRDLEPGPRGVYCGAVGVLAPPEAAVQARFAVAIRTAVVDRRTGAAVYGSGGGVTWDSRADAERRELLAKAAVLTAPAGDHELLETLAHLPGAGWRDLPRHLARLADSAAYFDFRCDPGAVRRALDAAVAGRTTAGRVRLRLARDGTATVEVADLPAPAHRPVTLALDDVPVRADDVWLHHKTTHRQTWTAAAARHPSADDVLLVNDRGELTETTIANVAVRLSGRWWTPPTSSGCLPGVGRARLLAEGVLAERVLRPADLAGGAELAVVSSLRGWRPAVLVDPPGQPTETLPPGARPTGTQPTDTRSTTNTSVASGGIGPCPDGP